MTITKLEIATFIIAAGIWGAVLFGIGWIN